MWGKNVFCYGQRSSTMFCGYATKLPVLYIQSVGSGGRDNDRLVSKYLCCAYSSVEANRPISPIRTQSTYRPTPQRKPPPKPITANIYKVSHSPQGLCHRSCQTAQQMCRNIQRMLMCSPFAHSCHGPFDMLSFIMALHNNPSITCLVLDLSCLQAC